MRPELEPLDSRDCPGLAWHYEHYYACIVAADYPIAPAGQQVVAMQDMWNVVSPFAQWHPTPLMPVPPASFNLPLQWSLLSDVQNLNEWSVPQSGGDAFGFIDTATWLAAQHDLYWFDTAETNDPAFWDKWLADVQSNVQAANERLFAAQDAYWSQPPTPEQPLQEAMPQSVYNQALVAALLSVENN